MIDFKNPTFVTLRESADFEQQVAPILLENEETFGGYKGIRDGVIFTDKRIIVLNIQGLTGKKRDFTSLPYSRISAYSVETAGTFDRDAELDVWISGVGKIRFEFKGQTNVLEISKVISRHLLRLRILRKLSTAKRTKGTKSPPIFRCGGGLGAIGFRDRFADWRGLTHASVGVFDFGGTSCGAGFRGCCPEPCRTPSS